ncbi:MAG: hypothetical protein CME06_02430 [Gemmatimonadetes bacterium]|nr:hypothetical protein [Gemmatimonadota bacterium]
MRARRSRWGVLSLCAIIPLLASNAAAEPEWACVQRDAQHTGRSDATVFASTPTLSWQAEAGGSIFGSPVVRGDGVIAVSTGNDRHLRAFSPLGQELLSFEAHDAVMGAPAVGSDDAIYLADLSGYVYKLSAGGVLEWEYRNTSIDPEEHRILCDPTPMNTGGVFLGDWLMTLSWIDEGTAVFPPIDQVFGYTLQDYMSAGVAVSSDGSILYQPLRFGSGAEFVVFAASTADGAGLWLFQDDPIGAELCTGSMQVAAISIDEENERLFVAANHNCPSGAYLYALDLTDGTPIWADPVDLGAGSYAIPALSPSGASIHLTMLNGELRTIDAATGNTVWTYSSGAEMIRGSAAVDAAGKIVFGDMNGVVHCLDAGGGVVWKYAGDSATIAGSIAIAGNGDVLFGTTTGMLSRLTGNAGTPLLRR